MLHTEIQGPAFDFGSAGAAGPLFDLNGNELPRSPTVSLSETILYTYHLSSSLDLVSEANVAFRSRAHMDLNNFPMATQPAYAIVNGSIGIASTTSHWEITLWVRNLTNVITYLADGPVGFGERDIVVYSMPRTFGISTRHSF